jgi:hypothetical protein
MSSIASKTKTVQSHSTEETKVNPLADGNQITNVNQMSNKNQMEELHIAEEATSSAGEQSESRQSGAEHPNQEKSSAEQDFCKTGPSERAAASKYKYAIFDGYAGEEYLKDLVREILPAALYRTWAIAVGYQAPGNACYVGVSRIAEKAKRGERQIQKDRRETELRGLLRRYASWVQVKEQDGTWSRKVRIINNYDGLYDLAYEYHLWKISAAYVPAEWESADFIREDEELYEKLIRFDCYRRILVCKKPGPKTELSDLHKVYKKHKSQNEQEQDKSDNGQQEAKTNNYLPHQLNKKSPYEETKNPESSIIDRDTDSSEDLEGSVFESISPKTIRNEQQSDQTETNTREQVINKYEEKPKEQENVQDGQQRWRTTNQNEIPAEKEMPAESAKDVTEYTIEDIMQNPLAVLTFLQQYYAAEQAKAHKQEQARAAKAQRHQQARAAKHKRRKTPEKLAQVITEMMQTLGGNPQYLQSDLTRATKIYWACTQLIPGFTNPWFLDQLTTAFIETANGKNVRKHVPYFFDTLERNLGLRNDERAYIRSKEVLYCNADPQAFIIGLVQLYESSSSHLDYDQWIKETYL